MVSKLFHAALHFSAGISSRLTPPPSPHRPHSHSDSSPWNKDINIIVWPAQVVFVEYATIFLQLSDSIKHPIQNRYIEATLPHLPNFATTSGDNVTFIMT